MCVCGYHTYLPGYQEAGGREIFGVQKPAATANLSMERMVVVVAGLCRVGPTGYSGPGGAVSEGEGRGGGVRGCPRVSADHTHQGLYVGGTYMYVPRAGVPTFMYVGRREEVGGGGHSLARSLDTRVSWEPRCPFIWLLLGGSLLSCDFFFFAGRVESLFLIISPRPTNRIEHPCDPSSDGLIDGLYE